MSNKTNSDNNQKRRDALDHARRAAEYARLANLAVNDRIRSELLHLRQAALRSVRRIATRYDKTDASFAAAIYLVGVVLALK